MSILLSFRSYENFSFRTYSVLEVCPPVSLFFYILIKHIMQSFKRRPACEMKFWLLNLIQDDLFTLIYSTLLTYYNWWFKNDSQKALLNIISDEQTRVNFKMLKIADLCIYVYMARFQHQLWTTKLFGIIISRRLLFY